MDITVVTSAETDEQGRALLTALGFPFRQADDGSRQAAQRNRRDQEVHQQMAKKSLIAKAKRTPKFKVRGYTRCQRCGRPRAVLRKFGLCRICVRQLAHAGELPGVTKSSW